MMSKPTASHQIKYLAAIASLVFIWLVWRLNVHHEVSEQVHSSGSSSGSSAVDNIRHRLGLGSSGGSSGSGPNGLDPTAIVPASEAEFFCDHYRMKPMRHETVRKRKIYDLFLLNTELEMLELRMGQMAPHVDYFVILESNTTFQDNEKPLFVKENMKLFKQWESKMIRRTMDLNALKDGSTWDRERGSRNALFSQVFPTLKDEQTPHTDDIIIVSDVDEIPKPDVLRAMRNCEMPQRVTIHSAFYYYSYQWHNRDDWPHPQATLYKGDDTVLPDELRGNAGDYHFLNGGWHCSYCFSTVAEMAEKINSFSHSELNKPEFKNPEWIVDVARRGLDIFGRGDAHFDRITDNFDVPDYVKRNPARFNYLVDRDPPNGNFRDYTPKPKAGSSGSDSST